MHLTVPAACTLIIAYAKTCYNNCIHCINIYSSLCPMLLPASMTLLTVCRVSSNPTLHSMTILALKQCTSNRIEDDPNCSFYFAIPPSLMVTHFVMQ